MGTNKLFDRCLGIKARIEVCVNQVAHMLLHF